MKFAHLMSLAMVCASSLDFPLPPPTEAPKRKRKPARSKKDRNARKRAKKAKR